MVYQAVYHRYDKTFIFYCSNYICNQFIIAISHLRGLWYMVNIPRLRAVSRHSALRCVVPTVRTALSCGILAIYSTTPLVPYCLIISPCVCVCLLVVLSHFSYEGMSHFQTVETACRKPLPIACDINRNLIRTQDW